jgi:hypothetical protein
VTAAVGGGGSALGRGSDEGGGWGLAPMTDDGDGAAASSSHHGRPSARAVASQPVCKNPLCQRKCLLTEVIINCAVTVKVSCAADGGCHHGDAARQKSKRLPLARAGEGGGVRQREQRY